MVSSQHSIAASSLRWFRQRAPFSSSLLGWRIPQSFTWKISFCKKIKPNLSDGKTFSVLFNRQSLTSTYHCWWYARNIKKKNLCCHTTQQGWYLCILYLAPLLWESDWNVSLTRYFKINWVVLRPKQSITFGFYYHSVCASWTVNHAQIFAHLYSLPLCLLVNNVMFGFRACVFNFLPSC